VKISNIFQIFQLVGYTFFPPNKDLPTREKQERKQFEGRKKRMKGYYPGKR